MKEKMFNKKSKLILCFLFLGVLVLTACAREEKMDELSEDGKFNYRNEDLGFRVSLPESFEHYQSERREGEGYTEIIFLVPSGDTSFFRDVAGYARPITVRIYQDGEPESGPEKWEEFGQKNNHRYFVSFWSGVPKDWQDVWDEDMKKEIRESLRLK